MVILWAWTALLSGFLLFPLFVHQVNAFIPFGAAALGVGLYTFFHPGLRGNGDDEEGEAEGPPGEPSQGSARPIDAPSREFRHRRRQGGQRGARVPAVIVWTPSGPGCDDEALCSPSTSPRPAAASAAVRTMDSGAPRTA